MSLHGIAYHTEENLLLTLDGTELLAHDAQTEAPRWRLTFAHPLLAVLFAESGALPSGAGEHPWRNQSTARCVVAVDAEGGIHVIDPVLGQEAGTLGPFGTPVGVAAGAGGRFALATADRVFLWRGGEKAEIMGRSSAIAFSNDGATLAIGEADGSLRFFSVSTSPPPAETFCAVVHGGVTDLVQHPGGAWVVAGRPGSRRLRPPVRNGSSVRRRECCASSSTRTAAGSRRSSPIAPSPSTPGRVSTSKRRSNTSSASFAVSRSVPETGWGWGSTTETETRSTS